MNQLTGDFSEEELIPESGSREYYEYKAAKRAAERKAANEKRVRNQRLIFGGGIAIFILIIVIFVILIAISHHESVPQNQIMTVNQSDAIIPEETEETGEAKETEENQNTSDLGDSLTDLTSSNHGQAIKELYNSDFIIPKFDSTAYQDMTSDEVTSKYAILVDLTNNRVTYSKQGFERIYPASMTKLLTILAALDYIEDYEDTVTVTIEATDYAFSNDCSIVGFEVGEVVTVRDLLYGTILASGGDAAYMLAEYVGGSQEAFARIMNDKLDELGLSKTSHFTNCVGIYDENHYTTAEDMAVIMGVAVQSDFVRELIGARTYNTSVTTEHPEGILISNWFMRRIEDKDCGGEVLGAKTGFVNESGCCAVSAYQLPDGTLFACVTADTHSSWRAIYDHVAVYNIYAAGNTEYRKN